MITTTETISANSPELLRNSIDDRIVKVRPMSTPIDQLSRCGRSRRSGSMTVEYYSVDTKKTESSITENAPGGAGAKKSDSLFSHVVKTADDTIFEASETILVPEINGYNDDGTPGGPLVLTEDGELRAMLALPQVYLSFGADAPVRAGYVYALACAPARRGEGWASMLVETAAGLAGHRGCECLLTVPAEPELFGFFAKNFSSARSMLFLRKFWF